MVSKGRKCLSGTREHSSEVESLQSLKRGPVGEVQARRARRLHLAADGQRRHGPPHNTHARRAMALVGRGHGRACRGSGVEFSHVSACVGMLSVVRR